MKSIGKKVEYVVEFRNNFYRKSSKFRKTDYVINAFLTDIVSKIREDDMLHYFDVLDINYISF